MNNYGKYVKEMYWPKTSVKKQVELQLLQNELRSKQVRRSAMDLQSVGDEDGTTSGSPKRRGLGYERPWRKAISKNI